MALRMIREAGDKCLEKKCRAVEKFDGKLHELLDDMKETLEKANGVGLAAPQVGILKRLFIINVDDNIVEFMNPEIISTEGSVIDVEGCLSVPGKAGTVERPKKATVRAQDRNGDFFEFTGEGIIARCICHENDHLDGILYTSKVIEYVDLESEVED